MNICVHVCLRFDVHIYVDVCMFLCVCICAFLMSCKCFIVVESYNRFPASDVSLTTSISHGFLAVGDHL